MPTETRATTSPSSTTGTTARIERPERADVLLGEDLAAAGAPPRSPTNCWPICDGVGVGVAAAVEVHDDDEVECRCRRAPASANGCSVARRVGGAQRLGARRGSRRPSSATATASSRALVAGVAAGVERRERDGGDHQDEHDQHLQQQDLAGDRALPTRQPRRGHAGIVPHARGATRTRRGRGRVNSTNTRVTAVTAAPQDVAQGTGPRSSSSTESEEP